MLPSCVYASFVYFGRLPWLAFGNEVARMISLCSIIEKATRTSAFPHNKQTKSWFVLETPHSPPKKANSPDATFARCSLYARARILKKLNTFLLQSSIVQS